MFVEFCIHIMHVVLCIAKHIKYSHVFDDLSVKVKFSMLCVLSTYFIVDFDANVCVCVCMLSLFQ